MCCCCYCYCLRSSLPSARLQEYFVSHLLTGATTRAVANRLTAAAAAVAVVVAAAAV